MSHSNKLLRSIKHKYVGILSSLDTQGHTKDIDYLLIMSGFLDDKNRPFARRLLKESKYLTGKKVFVLGGLSKIDIAGKQKNNLRAISLASVKLRNNLLNRAKVVISRPGYSTVMDLVELGLPAVLIPTKFQSEQEYLAEYLGQKKYFATFASQDGFTLRGIEAELKKTKLLSTKHKTAQSLEKIDQIVSRYVR